MYEMQFRFLNKNKKYIKGQHGRWNWKLNSDEAVTEGDEREQSLPEKENKNGLAKEEKPTKHTKHTQSKVMG